ncbi:hypothetical protein [Gilvibacter sediminis]|uniref:hypothetical protein n=1 Tax=Gilvibacter sediminis TaxID=379071 RepID=UPI0023504C7F|nr:hypothetical protein [Gilvibacter sediminis]MDC7996541.1 hypothetical protein [Gilvibacter sediminis]
MKSKQVLNAVALAMLLVFTSCSSDPCDEGYTAVEDGGTTACLPDYVVGLELNMKSKTRFFHKEFGVITFDNGRWSDPFGEDITQRLKH